MREVNLISAPAEQEVTDAVWNLTIYPDDHYPRYLMNSWLRMMKKDLRNFSMNMYQESVTEKIRPWRIMTWYSPIFLHLMTI